MRRSALLLLMVVLGLTGCEDLGIVTPAARAAKKDADAKAIGSACRHAGRAIEDCYALNKRADKAAVFAGWREMNDYMRENSIAEVAPVILPEAPKPPAPVAASTEGDGHGDSAPGDAEPGDSADRATAASGH